MSTNLNPSAFRRLEAIGYIPGECNPIAWMLDRLERAAKVKPDDAAALVRRAHDMVRDLCKRRDEPGAREWQMSIPARPDHDPDLVIGAALDAADDLASEVGRLRDALATVTRERDEARQHIPAAQSCHRLADYMSTNRDLLEYDGCDMAGDGAIDVLGRLARERDELRAALTSERVAVATMVDHIIDRKGWLPESAPEPMQTMQRHYEMTCKAAGDNGNTIEDLARAIGIDPDADDLVAEARKRIAALAGAKS